MTKKTKKTSRMAKKRVLLKVTEKCRMKLIKNDHKFMESHESWREDMINHALYRGGLLEQLKEPDIDGDIFCQMLDQNLKPMNYPESDTNGVHFYHHSWLESVIDNKKRDKPLTKKDEKAVEEICDSILKK